VGGQLELSRDATTVVGLAGTALAFAASVDEEVERWLCALRLYGEAGVVLQALGLDDEPSTGESRNVDPVGEVDVGGDRVAAVLTCSGQFATQRGSRSIGTPDLLMAVMQVYGGTFDSVLERRGIDRVQLLERWTGAGLRRDEKARAETSAG
jgi:hypothetical protein